MSAAPPFAEPWRNRPDTFVAAIATAVRNASTQISARVSVALSRHELLEFDLAAGGGNQVVLCCRYALQRVLRLCELRTASFDCEDSRMNESSVNRAEVLEDLVPAPSILRCSSTGTARSRTVRV
ncbi:MAG: hypothetical protein ACJAY5_001792 [Actinomycetes bacterium]|jgi:hypothetical protein